MSHLRNERTWAVEVRRLAPGRVLLALALLLAAARGAAPFSPTLSEGSPQAWPEARAVVHYDPATFPPGFAEELEQALAAWSSVPGSAFRFTFGGPSPAPDPRRTGNGVSECWFDPSLSPAVYALTFTDYVDGVGIVEKDIVFSLNPALRRPWTTTPGEGGIDFRTVAMHELGHAAGLDHVFEVAAVMSAFLSPLFPSRVLLPDDEDGLRWLYPGGTGTGADLRVSGVAASVADAGPGDGLTVDYSLANRGDAASATAPVSLWLATSAWPAEGDVLLGEAVEAALAAGGARAGAFAETLPDDVLPGLYRVRVQVDHAGDAARFDDRAASAARVAVRRPAVLLAAGQPARGRLGPAGEDSFGLALPAVPTSVRVRVTATVADGLGALLLRRPDDGDLPVLGYAEGWRRIRLDAGASGETRLLIASREWAPRDYEVVVRAAPASAEGVVEVAGATSVEVPVFAGGRATLDVVAERGMRPVVALRGLPAGFRRSAAGDRLKAGPFDTPGATVTLDLSPGDGPPGRIAWRVRAKPGRDLLPVVR